MQSEPLPPPRRVGSSGTVRTTGTTGPGSPAGPGRPFGWNPFVAIAGLVIAVIVVVVLVVALSGDGDDPGTPEPQAPSELPSHTAPQTPLTTAPTTSRPQT